MTTLKQELLAIKSILASFKLAAKTFFNVSEAASYLSLSEDAVYRLMAAKKLKHSRPNGKVIYIQREYCDQYVRLNTVRTIDEIEAEAALRVNKKGGKW
ncbi:helix-turn-helix domain-containing protein [Pontibacter locisalis]|uniref:Helix-turn-helix domain-containing protein n=1 Tax=Pontibacter locisalis TaxID=1719035 RepID=A0ABW5IKJ6_9BACT